MLATIAWTCLTLTTAAAHAAIDTAALETIGTERGVAGIGVAVIREGRIASTAYWGEARPGAAVTEETMFNTASLAKTVTAELALRMSTKAMFSLDAPIAATFTHPDLADDERYAELTPRQVLTHRSGLKNWAYEYDDFKLAFIHAPGTTFTYSGAAVEILGHYLEALGGKPFPELVTAEIFEPLGMRHASISREPWIDRFVAHPMNAEGEFVAPYTIPGVGWTKPESEWDGADNLYVSVSDYARFLLAVANGDGISAELHDSRFTIETDATSNPAYACIAGAVCPNAVGYGLGWMTFEFDDATYLQHGGSDFGEIAFAYYHPESASGAVVLVTGGAGHYVPLDVTAILDPGNPLVSYFTGQYDRCLEQDQVRYHSRQPTTSALVPTSTRSGNAIADKSRR